MQRRPLRKLLVANRGEIALRIIRSAHVLGLETAAVYSEADSRSTHVLAAGEAALIGPPEPASSYLKIPAIIDAARRLDADAIHPGYGFLSERPEFAAAAAEAGLIFVGPPPSVMATLGDKVAARKLATKAGVPVVPGSDASDSASARQFAKKVGYPILIKAAAGGGGRGMRIVDADSTLDGALESASREALAAFGDGRIFLEKHLARPRHVEVQILADERGNVATLGERDCSIQRRHQKVIEESPAPLLPDALRNGLTEAALRLARAAGYRNAGTVEFLVDGESFYFLEVNARLQVEHPITEIRFGRDLVCDQLMIAAGEKLTEVGSPRGAAIECRINAEDAAHDFRPMSGRIIDLSLPGGPGVRIDTHLTPGAEMPPYYDSLAAKLITYGENREQARTRMVQALSEFAMVGVSNNAEFLRDIVMSRQFESADLSTSFIPEHFSNWKPSPAALPEAAIAAVLIARGELPIAAAGVQSQNGSTDQHRTARPSPWSQLPGFELWARR